MAKHWTLAIMISVIVIALVMVALYMIKLPQVENLASEVVPTYEVINSSEFQFVEDKHFVKELLSKKYSIDSTDLNKFKSNKQYKPGNYDPFTPKAQINSSVNSSTQANANSNTTNGNSTASGSSASNNNSSTGNVSTGIAK